MKIYKQKVFLHHYEKFVGDKAETVARFEGALTNCESVIEDYETMEARGSTELSTEEIDAARKEVLRLNPDFSIRRIQQNHPFKYPDDFEVLAQGLRTAGLIEDNSDG